jgi:hypothetical protein
MTRHGFRLLRRCLLASSAVAAAAAASGCASSNYSAQVVARGELTLRYDGGFEMSAAGRRVASGLTYGGLEHHVRCVPQAREHAVRAASAGRAAIAFSVLGGTLGAGGLVGLVGLVDQNNWVPWVAGGLGSAAIGLTFSILSWRYKNHANGNAIDAMNFYNDSVGSLGATCDELVYPAPAGPAPLPQPPTVPMTPGAEGTPQPATQPPSF